MNPTPDHLARLAAQRNQHLLQLAADCLTDAQRVDRARAFGARYAAQRLTWAEVIEYRERLAKARRPGSPNLIDCGRSIVFRLGADDIVVHNYAEYVAFLEGVEDTARAIEARG